jgi:hypothetical protein
VDHRPAKLAPPLPLRLPSGAVVLLRPLPPLAVEQAWLDVRLELEAHGLEPEGAYYLIEGARALLRAACGVDLAEELLPAEMRAVFRRWSAHQQRCNPLPGKLSTWLRKRVNDDLEIVKDGWRAVSCRGAAEFYGKPLVDVTDGQLAYWEAVGSAYREFHIPDAKGRRKTPTKQWLKSDDE